MKKKHDEIEIPKNPIAGFIETIRAPATKKGYRSAIYRYLDFIYAEERGAAVNKWLKVPSFRAGPQVTEEENDQYERLAREYLTSSRAFHADFRRFNEHYGKTGLNSPPMTVRAWGAAVRSWFIHYDIEFSGRENREIKRFVPNGRKRTKENELSRETLRRIVEVTDVRGKAMILSLISSGIRIGELLKVRISDLDMATDPWTLHVRDGVAKNGYYRFTFVSHEAARAIEDWLKARNTYLDEISARDLGERKGFHGKNPDPKDDRLFPFAPTSAARIWRHAVKNAVGVVEIDTGTNRSKLHIHQLRGFFISELKMACPGHVVEKLAGHEGAGTENYLPDAYNKTTPKGAAECYLKGMHKLTLQLTDEEIAAHIGGETGKEIDKLKKQLAAERAEKETLRKELETIKSGQVKFEDFMELVKKKINLNDIPK